MSIVNNKHIFTPKDTVHSRFGYRYTVTICLNAKQSWCNAGPTSDQAGLHVTYIAVRIKRLWNTKKHYLRVGMPSSINRSPCPITRGNAKGSVQILSRKIVFEYYNNFYLAITPLRVSKMILKVRYSHPREIPNCIIVFF